MSEPLRARAVEFYRRGLGQITPEHLLRRALDLREDRLVLSFLDRREELPLSTATRFTLIAVGKAAAPMAAEAARLLNRRIRQGIVVTKHGFALPGLPFPVHETGHPVPDDAGMKAADAVEAIARNLRRDDVLLALVSGGASALLPAPIDGVTLADKQELARRMLHANMDIHQINRVRKALSRLKGGGLAVLAHPARVVGLCLSDVPGDDLGSIGSGLTVPEPVRFADVIALLQAKGLWEVVSPAVRKVLEQGCHSPKRPPLLPINGLVGTNRHLLRAIAAATEAAGFRTRVVEAPTTGLNTEALPMLLRAWNDYRLDPEHAGRPLCLISGGETTVEVRGKGIGGRCQELAALMLPHIDGDWVFLAAGSDGNDGPTDAAGGVVDRESWLRIQNEGIPYEALLADNDSYRLLERSGNLIKVPPTRNNVMDVHLFLQAGVG